MLRMHFLLIKNLPNATHLWQLIYIDESDEVRQASATAGLGLHVFFKGILILTDI
jgi:hypothetical protein